jgi:Ecdysteroid kinase-like family
MSLSENPQVSPVPAQCDDITVDWLNTHLPDAMRGVASVRVENLGAGVGILGEVARLHLTYQAGVMGPATMVAKCQSTGAENIFIATIMGFYLREVNFYQQVASTVPMRVPTPYIAMSELSGAPFVLVMEDIVGSRCPNQIEGISVIDAERIIDTVSALHVHFWNNDELFGLDWLPPMNNPLYKGAKDLAIAKWEGFQTRFGSRVDPKVLDAVGRVIPKYPEMLDWWIGQGHPTFTHTDCRAENYLFGGSAGTDAVTMVDFQLCTRHVGAWDLANLVAGSLTPEVRRANETALVERYHANIVSGGITDYDLATCWRHYRASLLQQAFSSVVVSDLDPSNERGAELLEQLFMRPWLAAADHDVASFLDEF